MVWAVSVLAVACSSGQTVGDSPGSGRGTRGESIVIEGTASVAIRPAIERRLSYIDIVPRQAIVPAGERIAFSAVAYDQRGVALLGTEVRWSMKDDMAGRVSPAGIFHAATSSGIFSDAVEVSVSYRGDGELEQLQSLASDPSSARARDTISIASLRCPAGCR